MTGAPESNTATILAVDDAPENLTILTGLLKGTYRVQVAINGATALRIARQHPPDLILLDIMMPELDGYAVCRRLKQDPVTRDIPIIFVTAMGEEEDELAGLALGAVDYVTKPISPAILLARIETHLALRCAQAALLEKNRLLEHERGLVESIVLRMRADDHFDGRHLRFLAESVEKTNGDVLFSAFRPDGAQHLLLGDFTGHGLPAAIGGPLVAQAFYDGTREGVEGRSIIERINGQLYRRLPVQVFMAAAFVEVAADRQTFQVWNAGLPDLLLLPGDGSAERLKSVLPPLGVLAALSQGIGQTGRWSDQGRLVIFSDGWIEPANSEGEMFGLERMERFLLQFPPGEISYEDLLAQIRAFSVAGHQDDDMTLLELRR